MWNWHFGFYILDLCALHMHSNWKMQGENVKPSYYREKVNKCMERKKSHELECLHSLYRTFERASGIQKNSKPEKCENSWTGIPWSLHCTFYYYHDFILFSVVNEFSVIFFSSLSLSLFCLWRWWGECIRLTFLPTVQIK